MDIVQEKSTGLRTGALTARLRRRDVRTFYRSFAEQHPSVRRPTTVARRVLVSIGWTATLIGLFSMFFGMSQEIDEGAPDMVGELVAMSAICGLFVVAGVILGWARFRLRAQRGTPSRHYRLAWFAHENGWTYLPGPLEGSHLTPWKDRGTLTLTRVMRPNSGFPIEFANYELRNGSHGSRNTGFGGICAMRLPSPLPHIVLQAKKNGRALTSAVPARAQVLSLEGNFDEYFTLYCPKGYERDALYLFTPDVMVQLIDHVNGFDVEIIDDWLFLESSRDVVTTDPGTWDTVARATSAVALQIGRWSRWRDTGKDAEPIATRSSGASSHNRTPVRRPGPRVGPRGRRLRMTIGSGGILGGILVLAYIAVVAIANLVR
jgi:hypothetical protein